MPFKSEKQRRYLYARHPEIARRWSAEEKAVSKSQPSYGGGGTVGRRMTAEQLSEDVSKDLKQFGYGLRNIATDARRKGARFLDDTNAELKETFRPFTLRDERAPITGRQYRRSEMLRHRAAETVSVRPKAAGTLAAGTLAGTYSIGAHDGRVRERRKVTKRYRDYNPEHRRQRRIGAAEATLLGTGGTAAGFGGRGVYRDTKALRGLELRNIQGKTSGKLGQTAAGRGVVVLTRRNAGLLAGGGLALSGAAGVRRWAEGNRGRSYD